MGTRELYPDLPDVLVGLGGNGKNIVQTILEQEWVVESIAAAATDGGPPECYLVDADTGQLQDDETIAAELNSRIQEAILLKNGGVPGGARDMVSILNLATDIEDEVADPLTFLTEQVAGHIVQETEVETWWLTEDGSMSLPDGFSHGTVRQRALGQALPPATQVLKSRDPLGQVVPRTPGG